MRTMSLDPVALALAAVLATGAASAQDHSHHAMPQPSPAAQDHSQHQPLPAKKVETGPHDHARHATPSSTHDHSQHDAHPSATPEAKPAGTHDPAHGAHTPVAPTGVDHAAMGHAPPSDEASKEPIDHSQHGIDHDAAGTHAAHAPAPAEPREPIPALTDADRAAAFPPDLPGHTAHDRRVVSFVQFNRLEAWDADGHHGLAWEGQGWIGNDEHRLWARSEGERVGGQLAEADHEVFYGRPVAPWWDLLVGLRRNSEHGRSQTFAGIGLVGLAPYKFEVEATAYLGESGQTAAVVEAEYETLFTNRLILQSLVEAELYGKDDPQRGIGAGLNTVELGLRLRYEFTRRFAPYVGIAHERAFGEAADLRREDGEGAEDTRVVAGFRIWF